MPWGANFRAWKTPSPTYKKDPEANLREEEWKRSRNMWSTVSLFHAAGRQLYRRGNSWAALPSPEPGFQISPVYDFVPARVRIDRNLRTTLDFPEPSGNLRVFHLLDEDSYPKAIRTSLRRLLSEMLP